MAKSIIGFYSWSSKLWVEEMYLCFFHGEAVNDHYDALLPADGKQS
jgi:hypothetical protein